MSSYWLNARRRYGQGPHPYRKKRDSGYVSLFLLWAPRGTPASQSIAFQIFTTLAVYLVAAD